MLRNKISESRLTMAVSHSYLEERIAMFKSIQKSGRIAAVAIGLLAALSPLATPPAALAGGSVPTPELEKSYSFKVSSDNSYIDVIDINSEYCYLFNRDDENNLKKVSLINMNDGSISPVDIPKKSLYSTVLSGNDQLSWIEDSNLVVFSPEKQSRSTHSLEPGKNVQYCGAWVSKNDETACVIQYNPEDYFSYAFYDLKTDNKMQVCRIDSDYSQELFSKDGSCFYIVSTNADQSTVTLKVFDTKTGSTKSSTTHVNKITDSVEINSIFQLPNSEGLILQDDSYLIRADRDANLSTIYNDKDHAFADGYSSSGSCDYYPVYLSNSSNDLFEEDDDYYYLNEQDANLGVIDLQNGSTISSIAFPFGNGYLSDISHDGGVLLGKYSDDDRSSACLVDAQTGAKSEFDSKSDSLRFMNGDRKILATYFDDNNSSTLHVNIYKSNIPHSVPEDILYFVQTHLPFVIGGGVAIVLIIGGVIFVLCIRKKRAKTANGATAAAPKPQRKQRRRQKRAQQNAVAPTAPAMQVAPTEPARFCRHCGTPLMPEAQFCPKCGQKVD